MSGTFFIIELSLMLLAVGAAGGFLSGLLGVGGGVLFVPALFFTFTSLGLDQTYAMHVAVGTSLCIVFATGSTAAIAHYRRGAVDMARVRFWGPFIAAGVVSGALFAGLVEGEILKKIFAVITFVIAIYMSIGRDKAAEETPRHIPLEIQKGVCAAIGVIASMVGIGGAIMTIPMMSYIGMNMQRAIGTASALGILISLPGALGYMLTGLFHLDALPPWSLGYVSVPALLTIIPTSILMAPIGVSASHSLPKILLRRIFAVMLVIVSLRMFMSL